MTRWSTQETIVNSQKPIGRVFHNRVHDDFWWKRKLNT